MSDAFSENDLATSHATVEKWFNAFMDSPTFAALTDSQQRKAGLILNYFTEYTCRYLDLSPADWGVAGVRECCTEILPRKVSAELSLFEAIAPVLSAFFRFLGDQSLLSKGRALAEAVEACEDEIVDAAGNQANWGPAKQLVMAAHDAGVDLHNPEALQAFILQRNLQQLARLESTRGRHSSGPDTWGSGSGKPRFQPPANRYDPCPCGSGKKYKFCCEAANRA